MSHITIEPGSPAMAWLQLRAQGDRTIRITEARGGLQFKAGEGTWTTPLSTKAPDADLREFHRAECGHLLCKQCKGHKDYAETHEYDDDPESQNWRSCICCKHCNNPRGH